MSNARIVDRLNDLADAIENGSLKFADFRDTLLGHTEAIEGIPYDMVTEANYVWGQIANAIDAGDEQNVDVKILGKWLRNWAARVPTGPA